MSKKTFLIELNERPFNAIDCGKKNIEIRAKESRSPDNSINQIKEGDFIIFKKIESEKKLKCTVERKTLYTTVRKLLETEGTKYSLSSTNDIEEGIKSVESISNYAELIGKNGVFAIKLKDVTPV